jgi:hypothetical protein
MNSQINSTRNNLPLIELLSNVNCQLLKTGNKTVYAKYYFCSCDPDQKEPVCEECIKVCHKSHIKISTNKINAICQCGMNCHKVLNKSIRSLNFDRECCFVEWAEISRLNQCYLNTTTGNNICIFCANFCIQEDVKLEKNPVKLEACQCDSENHHESKNLYKIINEMKNLCLYNFGYLSQTHMFNLLVLGRKNFKNLYEIFLNYLTRMKKDVYQKIYSIDPNIAYSSFTFSLENFSNLIRECKDLNYFTHYFEDIFEVRFIYKLLEMKFDFKNMNVWNMKKNFLIIFYIAVIKKLTLKLQKFNLKDIELLNPLHRLMLIQTCREHLLTQTNFFKSQSYLDDLINIIEKLNNIKEKTILTYDILRICYKIIQVYAKFNLLTNETIIRLCVVNDDIVFRATDLKDIQLNYNTRVEDYAKKKLTMMKPMIRSLQYIVYYFNDSQLFEAYNNKKEIGHIKFFHSNSEISKMVNRNVINVLNYIRNNKYLDGSFKVMSKLINYCTNIISLSIDYPDNYLISFRRLINKNNEIYVIYLNDNLSANERNFLHFLNNEAEELQLKYFQYFEFKIGISTVIENITSSIKNVFSLLCVNPDHSMDNITRRIDKKDESSQLINNGLGAEDAFNLNHRGNRILMNKSNYISTVYTSLKIVVQEQNNINKTNEAFIANKSYLDMVFKLLYFYIEDSKANCAVLLSKFYMGIINKVCNHQLSYFIDILNYIMDVFVYNEVEMKDNKELLKIIKTFILKVSNKKDYVDTIDKVIRVIKQLTKIKFINQEFSNAKLRKLMKLFFKENPILLEFKEYLVGGNINPPTSIIIQTASAAFDEKSDSTTQFSKKRSKNIFLKNLADKDMKGYSIKHIFHIFIKFLYLINVCFDGNSTLNELDFLKTIIKPEEIPKILRKKDIDLKLRVEILKFFRMIYVDIIIDNKELAQYRTYFINPVDTSETNFFENGQLYRFFNELMSVNKELSNLDLECSIIKYELKYFAQIVESSKCDNTKVFTDYYEKGILYPLYIFLNKYMSIICDLKGYDNLKLYEIVVYFLKLKLYLMTRLNINREHLDINKPESLVKYAFKSFIFFKKPKVLYPSNFNNEDVMVLKEDIEEITNPYFEILNYNKVYSYYEKHLEGFINKAKARSLIKYFQKKEEYYPNKEKYEKNLETQYQKRIFEAIVNYENEKNKFNESAFVQNLSEQNVNFDTNYRNFVIRCIFFLISDERFTGRYRSQNFWNLFKLLQYETVPTQEDIFNLYQENSECLEMFKFTVNLFFENLLSLIFANCNLSQTVINEDYFTAITIIKIFKYLCEEHNNNFQKIFFQVLKFNYNNIIDGMEDNISLFDLLLGILSKIIIIAKWEKVKFGQNDHGAAYYYDIFFAIIELLIEMIQGTEKENLEQILQNIKEREENSPGFFQFLIAVKNILYRDKNDSAVLYKVRKHIIDFIVAFLEEKSTPDKLILVISNIHSPLAIMDSIVNTMKKLYLKKSLLHKDSNMKGYKKIKFDNKVCDYFTEQYFSNPKFCESPEFEFANRMYQYVKLLAAEYHYEDAISITDSIHRLEEQEVLASYNRSKKSTNEVKTNGVILDEVFYQNYFAVKFFESITMSVLVQKEDSVIRVLFTKNPLIPYLSANTRNEFLQQVNRETRYTKLFSLVEYSEYFYEEILYNSRKISKNWFLVLINKINFYMVECALFIVTVLINIIIVTLLDHADVVSDDFQGYIGIEILAFFQIIVNSCFIIIWFYTKFPLYNKIETKKYILQNKIKSNELGLIAKLVIVFKRTIIQKREIIGFIWNLCFSIAGKMKTKNLFVFALQLLIIVNLSNTLTNVVRSITLRYKQLIATAAFVVTVIFIFSCFAFFHLNQDFIQIIEGVNFIIILGRRKPLWKLTPMLLDALGFGLTY